MSALHPRLAAVLAVLPTHVTLTINRAGSPGASRHFVPQTDPGCWIACAPLKAYGGAWGRSEESAEAAVRACLDAGGKPLGSKKGDPRLMIYWQPKEAWVEHAKLYPEMADECGLPYVAQDGATCWWGSPQLTRIYAPAVTVKEGTR